jgi:hypothetical protein
MPTRRVVLIAMTPRITRFSGCNSERGHRLLARRMGWHHLCGLWLSAGRLYSRGFRPSCNKSASAAVQRDRGASTFTFAFKSPPRATPRRNSGARKSAKRRHSCCTTRAAIQSRSVESEFAETAAWVLTLARDRREALDALRWPPAALDRCGPARTSDRDALAAFAGDAGRVRRVRQVTSPVCRLPSGR